MATSNDILIKQCSVISTAEGCCAGHIRAQISPVPGKCDFLKVSVESWGNNYDNDDDGDDVIADVCRWCRAHSPEFFSDGIRQQG
ncbi:hypothetical protein ElyMa_002532600 [Elysia marginata]|uniref:Uncharacterized protein n=1 Tax=Elysia marginata TaxID=1093978 RepID=A0AAV4GVR2_9GAST|nr:hypothetical protein ElyMa_002532600 [Elysia marginata]